MSTDRHENAEVKKEIQVNPDVYIRIRKCLMQEGKSIYRPDIDKYCQPEYDHETVSFHLSKMRQRGEIRMKEDSIEHDWEYRKGRNW